MGNSPSVSGPERGRAHVKRDIRLGGQLAEQRPVSNTGSSDSELAVEEPVSEPNRESYFETTAEQPLLCFIGSCRIMK